MLLNQALALALTVGFAAPAWADAWAPDDPLAGDAWHLASIGATEAWALSRGEGQRIAIVDTGIDEAHPDLLIAPGFDFADNDADANPDLVDDDYPHGTAMAGIAAARGGNGIGVVGVAPMAEVLPIKALGGRGGQDDLARAIVYATRRDASVVLNAWSYSTAMCEPVPLRAALAESLATAEADGRRGLGAVVVMSAGNAGCELVDDDIAKDPRVVVVGAHDRSGAVFGYSNTGDAVDLLAPSAMRGSDDALWTTDVLGVLGYQNDGDYGPHGSGTSAAAATVAGVFALVLAANPALTSAEARSIVCETALPTEGARCGRVDATAAVAAARDAAQVSTQGCQTSNSCGGVALLLLALASLRFTCSANS